MSVRNAPTVGIRLKSAREAKGISLRDIAHATKISTRTLEALERGDFAKLHGGIYTRSIIRSYASSVGLDPEAVLGEFLAECPADVEPAPTMEPDAEERARAEPRLIVWASALLPRVRRVAVPLALACAAGYVVLSWNSRDDVIPSSAVDVFAAHALSAAPVEPAVTHVSRLLTGELREPPVGAVATWALTVEVQAESSCWFSVHADGAERASRLLAAGERAVVEADREIVLKVGDAGAVSVWINGRPAPPLGPNGKVATTRITADTVPQDLDG